MDNMKRLLLGLALIVMAVCPQGPVTPKSASAAGIEMDKVVAVVNKEVITWAELYKTMEFEFGQRINFLNDGEKQDFLKRNEEGYLDSMIDMVLQLQEAQRLNLGCDETEINEAVGSIKKKFAMDDRAFEETLRAEGFTLREYKRKISEQIIIGKLAAREVREKIRISDEDVNKFIEENNLRQTEEIYHILQVFIDKKEEDASQKAHEALRRIRSGEDFLSVAALFSGADPDLGLVRRNSLSPVFLSEVDKLAPGEASEPFQSEHGFHVITLQDKIGPDDKAALIQKARKELLETRFEERYKSWLKGLRQKAFVEIRL